jgi:hypothetical protein
MQDAARRQPLEELRSSRAIRHLSARQHESYRAAQLVGQGIYPIDADQCPSGLEA